MLTQWTLEVVAFGGDVSLGKGAVYGETGKAGGGSHEQGPCYGLSPSRVAGGGVLGWFAVGDGFVALTSEGAGAFGSKGRG